MSDESHSVGLGTAFSLSCTVITGDGGAE